MGWLWAAPGLTFLFAELISIAPQKNKEKSLEGPPTKSAKRKSAARGLLFWGEGKTTHSEKSIPKHSGKRTFGKIAQTRAVRKGELIKG